MHQEYKNKGYGGSYKVKKIYNYVLSFPVGLRPYIRHVKDVSADGNCGFIAIAGLVGLTEDGWR